VYSLSLDPNFSDFLAKGVQWPKRTAAVPTSGLKNDGDDVREAECKTAMQKMVQLNVMFGQTPNFCPIIARNTITIML
jgi:hypothetical protein